ncbi:MAG: AmmeMemoRadiSam system protein A [Sulfurovaceae bacterium]|nr:AmmeMemoRadiSam system protein A [Sulfurovaceae bacterium]
MKDVLLSLARAAIAESVGLSHNVDLQKFLKENPWLNENGAAFVTLNTKSNHALRGCIGSLVAHQKLYEDVINNAVSAAKHDPRFLPLTQSEFDEISIEVSVLSEPKELYYDDIDDLKNKIRPNIDGVILNYAGHRATFLPQVWEELSDFYDFFGHLCQKAGLSGNCLEKHPEISIYQVQKYKE